MIPRRKQDPLQLVNLNGPKSNTARSKTKAIRAGLDWLQLSFYGRNIANVDRVKLAELRERALTGEEPEYRIGNISFVVQPYGFGVGASHMAYVLRGDGLTIAFSKKDKSPEVGGPVMSITAPGSYCTGRDPVKLFHDLKLIASIAGCCFTRVGITRVDVHCDVDGRRVSDVVEAINENRVVCRAKRFSLTGVMNGEIETFYLGSAKSNTRLCVYDKVAELLKDPLKAKNYFERWGLIRWPDCCTRYEWRMDSESLRDNHGISSADEFFESLQTVVFYLMSGWYRECVVVDRDHCDRAEIHPEWKTITETSVGFFDGKKPRRRCVIPIPCATALLKQAAGCLAAAAASLGVLPEDGFNAAEFFHHELSANADAFRSKVMVGISRVRSNWGDIFSREDARKREEVVVAFES
jgi:hypothetical protein